MSRATTAGLLLGGAVLLIALVILVGVLFGVLVLYSLNWTLMGYAPTTHDAIVSLFVLTFVLGGGRSAD